MDEHRITRGGKRGAEDTRAQEGCEQSAGAYTPAGRKYGKRRPASFSSIRFELLSSRRALSIVAENYFIIARSAGLECSPLGSSGVVGRERGGEKRREEARTGKRVHAKEGLCSGSRGSAIY